MVKAVLFDMDGVLVDSEPISSESSDATLARYGIVQTQEERRRIFGRRTVDNYRDAIEARGLDLDPAKLAQEKEELFVEMIKGRIQPMPGVLRLLGELDDAGVKKAVVSSSALIRVNATLEEIGLLLEFDVIVSGECCRMGKPHPEPFLIAAEKLGVKPKDCVVIEDAEAGILAAKAGGMKVVAVRSPNTHGQDLSQADKIVGSIEDINLDFLNKL